jgi:hypothetical protein
VYQYETVRYCYLYAIVVQLKMLLLSSDVQPSPGIRVWVEMDLGGGGKEEGVAGQQRNSSRQWHLIMQSRKEAANRS